MPKLPKAQPVALILEDSGGVYVGVRFASRELARDFEDRHALTSLGCIDLVSQTEAALRGVLA